MIGAVKQKIRSFLWFPEPKNFTFFLSYTTDVVRYPLYLSWFGKGDSSK